MHDKPVSSRLADAPGFSCDLLAPQGSAQIQVPAAIPSHAEVIRRLNTTYLMAAREAAQHSIPYTVAAFGVPQTFADWLATAGVDEIVDLAAMPVCVFALRLPTRAIERAHRGRLLSPAAGVPPLLALHTALAGRRSVDQ
ncbi:hypothetical protein [Lamprocystis purpurea]|uniref:hypothetical protein n=1 Tax=Lamprocystis purpurea TaxID=61598 RepID=UPI0012FA9F96|nr:hypothetical protein [Lamprocystis purpurea]